MDELQLREKLLKYKVALQPNKQPIIWRTLCETIENDFAGDIRKLFCDNDYSVQKVKIYIAKNKFIDRENITVAPDTHVIQASERLGVISSEVAGQSSIQEI